MAPDPDGYLFNWGDDLSKFETISWEDPTMNKGGPVLSFIDPIVRIVNHPDGTQTLFAQSGKSIKVPYEGPIPDNFEVVAVSTRDKGSRVAGVSEELAFQLDFVDNDKVLRKDFYVMMQKTRKWSKNRLDKLTKFVNEEGNEAAKTAWREALMVFDGRQLELRKNNN